MDPLEKYNVRAEKINSLLCVGLDPDISKLPQRFLDTEFPQFEFNKWIIDQVAPFSSAFKPNIASYEVQGEKGWKELRMTMDYIQSNHPDIFTICDAKRADIGYTSELYARAILDNLDFDSITLHPYLGQDSLQPFLDRKDKISIILCRTSNPSASEFQDLEFSGKKLWEIIAETINTKWNTNRNCMLVVGATYPKELFSIRKIVGDMTILVPGVGTQGGSVEEVMKAGLNSKNKGLIINSSKAIIFAENPGLEAEKTRNEINTWR